ncbi:MAG: BREX system P-loop protein BrxC [Alkaliphilus sp.]
MKIQDLFHKQIDRDIKGVIKIGQEDDENVKQELEEYVVTRELRVHIDKFFTAYKKGLDGHTDKMGVWISGFFGSGKSHFLKVLSYILENKEVDGIKAMEYFRDKIDDSILLGDIKRASDIDSDVILFNIDSKADSDSKSNKEAIVKVFNKVFNDHLGYCGSIPWLAELEKKMDREGIYEAFKNKYCEANGETWQSARNDFFFIEDEFVECYSSVSDMSENAVRKWYNKAEEYYTISIEKFANSVKEHIESKAKNHRVIFLVDEIGQYIGDSKSLMLNLQTVAENLGTMCGGKAWIIVTSQQNIDSVVKVKSLSFSKIQGRFDTRLNMSSANVDEVIKIRLLRKKESNGAIDTLKRKYQDNESIVKNLLIFSSKTPDMKKFKSADEYADVYPYVPYQFVLLQSVFNSIRTHGASGKHLAEGERSLLSAFQESAIRYKDCNLDFIMPFYAFYQTIESFLDHDINIVMQRAIDNDTLDDFDVNVLKLLFLIKYLGEKMPPNLENISTLMVNNLKVDKIDLTNQVKESLEKLYKQALIQKNGDSYVFLTNAEQDINSDIQNMTVDYSEVVKSISAVIFDKILKADNKYCYNKEHIFTYNHKFDNDFYSSQKGELTLQIVSPAFNGPEDDENMLKMLSLQESSVIFKLPEVMSYFGEMEIAMQIETYLRRNISKTKIPEVERIKIAKSEEITTRKERAADYLVSSLEKAKIYAYGRKIEIKEKSPLSRIDDAFKILVENKYNKIDNLKPFVPSNGSKVRYGEILRAKELPVEDDEIFNGEAYNEVFSHIENMHKMTHPLTMKSITNKYGREPYHWRSEDLKGLMLRMVSNQAISLTYASEFIDKKDVDKIVDLISKDSNLDSIKIKIKIKPGRELLKKAKEIIKKAFNNAYISPNESQLKDDIVMILKREQRDEVVNGKELNIESYLRQYKTGAKYSYPGKQILLDGKEVIEKILNKKEEIHFFNAIKEAENDLLDYAEEVEHVKEFFNNKRKIFDEALVQIDNFKQSETYVADTEAISTIKEMEEIVARQKPYSEIYRLPELRMKFISIFVELLEKKSELVKGVVESNRESVLNYLENSSLSEKGKNDIKGEIENKFIKLLDELKSSKLFKDVIFKNDEASVAKELLIKRIDKKVAEEIPVTKELISSHNPDVNIKTKKKNININLTNYSKAFKNIESKRDLDDVVSKFRELLEKELKENAVIRFY